MQSANKKLSILKPAKPVGTPTPDETDVQSEIDNVNRTKRVSFQRKSLVKPFRLDEDNKNTVWDITYEEEVNHMDSSSSQNSDGNFATENVFNTTVNVNNDSEMEFTCQGSLLEISNNEILQKGYVTKTDDQKQHPEPSANDSEMEFTCQIPSLEIFKTNKTIESDTSKLADQNKHPLPSANDSEMEFTCQGSLLEISNNEILQKGYVTKTDDHKQHPEPSANDSEMEFTCQMPSLEIFKTNKTIESDTSKLADQNQHPLPSANDSEMEFTCQMSSLEICKTNKTIKNDTSKLTELNQHPEPSANYSEMEFTCQVPSFKIKSRADDNTATLNLKAVDKSNIIHLPGEHGLFQSSSMQKNHKLEEHLGNSSIHIKANHLPENLSENKCGFSSLLTLSDLYDSNKDSVAAGNDMFSNKYNVDAIRLEDESLKLEDSSITLGEFDTSSSIQKAEGLQNNLGEEASKKDDEEFLSLLNYECKPFTPTPSPFNAIDYTEINNLLKTSEERMEDLRNLRLKPINFPNLTKETEEPNSSDLSAPGPCDPEPTKYVNVARNDFEELKKLRTPKTLLEQILEVSERCKSYCDFLKHDGEKYWFKTLYGALVLVADLSSEGVVTNLKIEKKPSKRSTMTMLEHYVMKIFVESLEMNNLESALGFRFDVFSLMDYTHLTMTKMMELDDFLEKLQWTHSLEIDSHYRFVFKILEYRDIRQIWIISVDLSDSTKKLTPECVDVEIKTFGLSSEIKQRYVKDLKDLVQSCPKGYCFLKEYLEKIKVYVETLKKRKQLMSQKNK